jgi:hypothetical protein
MADVITRFKLETTQYDSKLRDAAKELSKVSKEAMSAGKSFNDFTQKNVEAARAFGKTESGAKNTKDKMRDLVGAFNDAAKAYNNLTEDQKKSDFGKALSQSLTQLQARIKETKKELYGLDQSVSKGGGGLFGGGKMDGMLSVLGGNLMTKGVMMATSAVTSFVGEIQDAVKQGIELAKQGEGIRIAFERIGNGQILDGLREATHGTVTDIELMKAAVKFNDFKLPIEELGTMLAFAQQKAKDTGQSVDYMVDSIVTGLGRKSLMILDNLGLSAAEIKDKMKDTGDMTKAVGAIIREQMAKAGDYVETAADRATAANVELTNAMTRLGDTFQPLSDTATSAWTSIKIGALDLLNSAIKPLIDSLTEAGRLRREVEKINASTGTGQTHSQKTLGMLKNYRGNKQDLYNRQIAKYTEAESTAWREVEKYRRGYNREKETGGAAAASYYKQMKEAEARAKAMQKFRKEYEEGAKAIFNPVDTSSPAGSPSSKGGKGGRGGGGTTHVLTEEQSIAKQIQDLTQEYIHATDERKTAIRSEIATLQERQKVIQQMKDEALGKTYTPVTDINKPGQGVSVMSGIDIKLPETISALSPLEAMNKELERTQELMMKAASPEEWAILNEHLESVKKNIEDFQGGGKQQANEAKNVTKSWQAASSAISSVGSALQSLEDPSARVFGIIAQAIASVAQGFAGALASPATTSEGIWAWIAAAAAGTATMISTIASIKSATSGNFAEGGIVPGNSYSGDNIRAYGLNSGELILNRSQQDSIASQLQDGGMQNLRLSATVTGDQIRLVLNNNGKRKGFGEQLTFK